MSLDLSNRNLEKIPYIDPNLCIHTLDLSGNQITEIINLPSGLINLNLSENLIKKVENIPDSVLNLDLWCNKITDITGIPTGLKYLNLSNNKIKKVENLSGEIEKLYIYENEITELSVEILKLINLKEINYYGNPIINIDKRMLRIFDQLDRHNLKKKRT